MTNSKTFHAVYTFKGEPNRTLTLTRDTYTSKAKLAEDMRASGMRVKLIFTESDYDKVMARIKDGYYMFLTDKEQMIYDIMNG